MPTKERERSGAPRGRDASHLVALCRDRPTISRAFEALRSEGFDPSDLSLVMEADGKLPDDEIETRPDASRAALAGGAIGTVGGAGIVGAAALTGLTLSGIGVLAAGPIGAALAAVVSGGVAGGLTGAMIGVGIPEDASRKYVGHLQGGAALVGVRVDEATRHRAERAFASAGIREVDLTTTSRSPVSEDIGVEVKPDEVHRLPR